MQFWIILKTVFVCNMTFLRHLLNHEMNPIGVSKFIKRNCSSEIFSTNILAANQRVYSKMVKYLVSVGLIYVCFLFAMSWAQELEEESEGEGFVSIFIYKCLILRTFLIKRSTRLSSLDAEVDYFKRSLIYANQSLILTFIHEDTSNYAVELLKLD